MYIQHIPINRGDPRRPGHLGSTGPKLTCNSRQAGDFAQSRALRLALCDLHILALKALIEYFQDFASNLTNLGVLARCKLEM